ncbi:hypothetical protein AOR10_01935 [Vibrio alginolyticus]|uniref:hypothetical protein n=1 Tax=Vibrio alginolyticus TaxID=663 RepID=UPI0006CA5FC8|nr:hypothetical protein [Vibrio alginolyticus]KPM94869.1 hypothetical protein AOR10_01935 [Vibrio alginolyticus]
MDLKIVEIKNDGTLNDEYVKLSVVKDCNLVSYLITDTTYVSETTYSNKLRHVYWLPRTDVKKGDTVIVYSGKGKRDSKNGIHSFYWGLEKSVWNNKGDAALLFEVNQWKSKKA